MCVDAWESEGHIIQCAVECSTRLCAVGMLYVLCFEHHTCILEGFSGLEIHLLLLLLLLQNQPTSYALLLILLLLDFSLHTHARLVRDLFLMLPQICLEVSISKFDHQMHSHLVNHL